MSSLEGNVYAILEMLACEKCRGTGIIHTFKDNPSSFVEQTKYDGTNYQMEIPVYSTHIETVCTCRLEARKRLFEATRV